VRGRLSCPLCSSVPQWEHIPQLLQAYIKRHVQHSFTCPHRQWVTPAMWWPPHLPPQVPTRDYPHCRTDCAVHTFLRTVLSKKQQVPGNAQHCPQVRGQGGGVDANKSPH
jgi:hypothetical protein